MTAIRLSAELRRRVDDWAKRQDDKPARSEAIRRLVERGLSSDVRVSHLAGPKEAVRAAAMAGKELDRLADQTAPADERARRKRWLLKGPKEFRD